MQVFIPQLRRLIGKLQEIQWEDLLQHVPDFELQEARDNLSTWLMRQGNARQYQDRFPDDYPRWHINLQEIFLSLPTDDQALVLVSWLALSQ